MYELLINSSVTAAIRAASEMSREGGARAAFGERLDTSSRRTRDARDKFLATVAYGCWGASWVPPEAKVATAERVAVVLEEAAEEDRLWVMGRKTPTCLLPEGYEERATRWFTARQNILRGAARRIRRRVA